MMARALPAIALALLTAACGADAPAARWSGTVDTLENGVVHVRNPAEGVWDEAEAWRIVEDLRIGTAMDEGPELFGSIIGVEVDAYGRIWVLDRQANELRVFGADGEHVRTVGGQGGGPGEFNRPVGLAWGPDDDLWVADPSNARYSVFDTTGEYLTSHRRPIGGIMVPWPGGIDVEGRLWDFSFSMDEQQLIRFDTAMQPADTFSLPEREGEFFELVSDDGRSRMRYSVPFAPGMTRFVDPRGYLWTGITDRYRVVQHSLDGDTLRIIDREYTPVQVSAEDREEALERLGSFREQGGGVDESRIPDVKPAYQRLFTDPQGFLWVVPSVASSDEQAHYDVFDPDGRYLGRVATDFHIGSYWTPVIRGDRFYTTVRDELEVQYVVRAHIGGRAASGAPVEAGGG